MYSIVFDCRAEKFGLVTYLRKLAAKNGCYLRHVYPSIHVKHLVSHWPGRNFVKSYIRHGARGGAVG